MPAKATVNGTVIAEADSYESVEGNIYFRFDSLKNKDELLEVSDLTTTCPWKGQSRYYDLHVNGKTLHNAAWSYPEPKEEAKHITDHIAFGRLSHFIQRYFTSPLTQG